MRAFTTPERLAALAGLTAALASLAGFIPTLYRDPDLVIGQSHGYDVGNLVVVVMLEAALVASARGALRGRLIAIGALGVLLYGFVTYAFYLVANPVTLLYVAVLGLGVGAFATGLADVDDEATEALLAGRTLRRVIAAFLLVLVAFFAATWLSQIAGAVTGGQLPAELRDIGWPMNPVWVLDLAIVLPLMAIAAYRLLTGRPKGARIALPMLVFVPLLGVTILAMAISSALGGQAIDPAMPAIFIVVVLVSTALAWLAFVPRTRIVGGHVEAPIGVS